MSADGGPAFPRPASVDVRGESVWDELGMSLRDYFAARFAHAEIVTAGAVQDSAKQLVTGAQAAGHTIEEHVAYNAYRLADAMIAERLK